MKTNTCIRKLGCEYDQAMAWSHPQHRGPTLVSLERMESEQLMSRVLSLRGGSSVFFAYLFLTLFGPIDNMGLSRTPCILFLQGEYKRNYLLFKGKNLLFRIWFQSYDFWKDPPLYFMRKALKILHYHTLFDVAWNIY